MFGIIVILWKSFTISFTNIQDLLKEMDTSSSSTYSVIFLRNNEAIRYFADSTSRHCHSGKSFSDIKMIKTRQAVR